MCTQPTQPVHSLSVDITQCSCCDRSFHCLSTSSLHSSVPPAQLHSTSLGLDNYSFGESKELVLRFFILTVVWLLAAGESMIGPLELVSRGVHRTRDLNVAHQSSVLRPPPPLIQAAPHTSTIASKHLHCSSVNGPRSQAAEIVQVDRQFSLRGFRGGLGDHLRHRRESNGYTLHHHPHR